MIGNERFLSTLTFDESDDEGAALTKTQAQQKREDFERRQEVCDVGLALALRCGTTKAFGILEDTGLTTSDCRAI